MEYNRRKYNNVPDNRTVNGIVIRFDSTMEARRYDELMILLLAGKIRNLQLQPEFTLIGAYKTAYGEDVKATRYKADFRYERPVREQVRTEDGTVEWLERWETVVEDVKTEGTRTAEYKLKRKLLLGQGIVIREVQA